MNKKQSVRRTANARLRIERKVARGARGLWFVVQRIEGGKDWAPLAGARISRKEALAYLARSFSRRVTDRPSGKTAHCEPATPRPSKLHKPRNRATRSAKPRIRRV